VITYKGKMGKACGLRDGSSFIEGKFADLPQVFLRDGVVVSIEYLDEAKAKREGMTDTHIPWRHDFKGMDVKAWRCKGGLLLKGKSVTWENR